LNSPSNFAQLQTGMKLAALLESCQRVL